MDKALSSIDRKRFRNYNSSCYVQREAAHFGRASKKSAKRNSWDQCAQLFPEYGAGNAEDHALRWYVSRAMSTVCPLVGYLNMSRLTVHESNTHSCKGELGALRILLSERQQ